jgi:hypothetical protein
VTGTVYWRSKVPDSDDFGFGITDEFIDGRTDSQGSFRGTWAKFSPYSWRRYGCGILGTGYGQRYVRQDDGRFMKVEG